VKWFRWPGHDRPDDLGFLCRTCRQFHPDPPMHYGIAAPADWYEVPVAERARRCRLSGDRCAIDGARFYLLGNLEVPVRGVRERFSWDVWVELGAADFAAAAADWDRPGRVGEAPYRGRLATALPGYPDTTGLEVRVLARTVGRRPLLSLDPADHPLAADQRDGMTRDRVREIAERLIHHPDPSGR